VRKIVKIFFILVFLVFFLLSVIPAKALGEKYALIRLEDVSPWYAMDPQRLQTLYQVADYLYSKHVPFSVSMIPVYVNPKEKINLSIEDLNNPIIQKFVEAIKYMHLKGGIIGLHGYTHQNGEGITALDFEFSKNPNNSLGKVSYMKERVEKALLLANKAEIPISYWETPHYTASLEQYKYLEENFSIMYEPGPYKTFVKEPYLVRSVNPKIGETLYIPTPLSMVRGPFDVKRLVFFAYHPNPHILASFFFHPFHESIFPKNGKIIKFLGEKGPYLETIITAFQKNGFTFITPIELRKIVIDGNWKQQNLKVMFEELSEKLI
jgi:hypothetical protein